MLMYRLQVLETLSKEFFRTYRRVIQNFLWDGKSPKIAYDRLTKGYKAGGLKLADLQRKDATLKSKWVQMDWLENVSLNVIFDQLFQLEKLDRWSCNLNAKDIKKSFKIPCIVILCSRGVVLTIMFPHQSLIF